MIGLITSMVAPSPLLMQARKPLRYRPRTPVKPVLTELLGDRSDHVDGGGEDNLERDLLGVVICASVTGGNRVDRRCTTDHGGCEGEDSEGQGGEDGEGEGTHCNECRGWG